MLTLNCALSQTITGQSIATILLAFSLTRFSIIYFYLKEGNFNISNSLVKKVML